MLTPAKHWIHGISTFKVTKYPSASDTYIQGQLVRLVQSQAADPSAAATLTAIIGVTASYNVSTAPEMIEVYDDPLIIYKSDLDLTTYLTDTGGAGSGVFTATHEVDIGDHIVIDPVASSLVEGQVGRTTAISTSANFTVTEPDGSGTTLTSVSATDKCHAIPGIGSVCEHDATFAKIICNAKDDGDGLMVDYSRELRKALEGINVVVNYSVPADWAYVFTSYAQKHVAIAGGYAAA